MTDINYIKHTLSKYEELLAQRELVKMEYESARKAIIPDNVQIDLLNLDEEFAPQLQQADKVIEDIKQILQAQVRAAGQRVDGENIQAVYRKPSWKIRDLVKLLQLAIKTPEIMECLEQSDPSASVQPIRRGE
jgi:hypothetical protein